ncbi:Cytochrome P450 2J2-like protein [Dinothrombium tinctorium]|uniref:Cytochrome P450 2J2-like protein n=1 Tax=Dinothrombium tinctorium TaxID=1965070 RepID=A0A3S3PYW0_9ACAR|nr:Cytochrome P450 2J2-like protein [Dinothrombium tinctorium]
MLLGSETFVVLNDWKSIKDALSKDDFLNRPFHSNFDVVLQNPMSLGRLNERLWSEQRRFFLRAFKNQRLETFIKDEIGHFFVEVEKRGEEVVDFYALISPITWFLVEDMNTKITRVK